MQKLTLPRTHYCICHNLIQSFKTGWDCGRCSSKPTHWKKMTTNKRSVIPGWPKKKLFCKVDLDVIEWRKVVFVQFTYSMPFFKKSCSTEPMSCLITRIKAFQSFLSTVPQCSSLLSSSKSQKGFDKNPHTKNKTTFLWLHSWACWHLARTSLITNIFRL